MWNKKSITGTSIVLLIVLAGVGAACTQNAADTTKTRVDIVLDATKSGAEKAVNATQVAGEKAVQAAHNAADVVTDSWITGKLKVKFADEKLLKGSDITVDTTNRVVTLSGAVLSAEARARAAAIASGTEGVASVVNQLVAK